MRTRSVSISEAKARLSALVNQVAYSQDRVILKSHGRPKAALVGIHDLGVLESGGVSSPVVSERRASLRRIEALTRSIRKNPAGNRPRSSVEDLRRLRTGRIVELGRLR